jgi:circadian clock protein KaiC
MVVLPIRQPEQLAGLGRRLTTGNAVLDTMTDGGLFAGSCTLVTGPTGTGKTLLVTQFLEAGAAAGEKTVLFAYEETREQVLYNARGWGHDLEQHEADGRLLIVPAYPEVASLDDHLVELQAMVERVQPTRIAVDSLSALERLGSPTSYREFVIGLTSYVKETGTATLVTASSPELVGTTSVTSSHISGLIDAILLLRYAEVDSSIRRAVTVLKMRGSAHDPGIREFTIDQHGMTIGEPFTGVHGILGQVLASG